MCPGLTNDLLQVGDVHMTAVIETEVTRLNVDIGELRETGLAQSGSFPEKHDIFLEEEKSQQTICENRAGFKF